MPFLATIIDELAAMIEPYRRGPRRARLLFVERGGKFEAYRNRRRPVLLSEGDLSRMERGTLPREMLSAPVEVRLDAGRVLSKVLQLPAASRDYLDAIVTHQLERMTPWTTDRVVFDYTLADQAAAAKDQIAVRLVAIARDAFESIIERMRSAGLKPAVVGTTEDPIDHPSPINLLGASRAARRAALRRSVATGLAVFAILAAAGSAYAGWRYYSATSEASAVQSEMQVARAAFESALFNTEATEGYRQLIAAKQNATPMLAVLDQLSELIPASTYLTEMAVEGPEVRIVGFSSEAPALIRPLEDSAILSDVRFAAPTTRDEGATLDRFEIVAQIVSAVSEEAGAVEEAPVLPDQGADTGPEVDVMSPASDDALADEAIAEPVTE